uniref:Uncharacterized protein n=1 Tax=Tetraselmis chuii TaxID=63592 RepID=A0A7S1X2C4_9CHLO|mmetsp:Transcript_21670/g.38633  ORF Transcript_21670/g.38633 Transcript_21670/m.38633 type:complete len:190 (+) Transcript_21670:234-803(+)
MDFHGGHDVADWAGTRKQFTKPAECNEWNFLKGAGPSAPQSAVNEEHRFRPAPFKSNWNRKKPEEAIKQYDEGLAKETVKSTRNEGYKQIRHDHLDNWNTKNRFNPITGQELDASTGTWRAAQDPWSHQRMGLKAVQPPGPNPESVAAKQAAAEARRNLRAERIATDGLTASQRIRTSSVRDNFDPSNM